MFQPGSVVPSAPCAPLPTRPTGNDRVVHNRPPRKKDYSRSRKIRKVIRHRLRHLLPSCRHTRCSFTRVPATVAPNWQQGISAGGLSTTICYLVPLRVVHLEEVLPRVDGSEHKTYVAAATWKGGVGRRATRDHYHAEAPAPRWVPVGWRTGQALRVQASRLITPAAAS
jgi:hypothetical protein